MTQRPKSPLDALLEAVAEFQAQRATDRKDRAEAKAAIRRRLRDHVSGQSAAETTTAVDEDAHEAEPR
jgi:hypothetical protein